MAKHNQVTMNLKIAAEAQLKNSKAFVRELDKISDNFDFGDKTNQQFAKAKKDLTGFNRVLEKVQSKHFITDAETKEITKASKEISDLITKTEQLYNSFANQGLQKYSKAYIKAVKEQQEAIFKIKQDYTNKTGKNFDKELANYDKLLQKQKELRAEQKRLSSIDINAQVDRQVEATKKKISEQTQRLKELDDIKTKSAQIYQDTLNSKTAALNRKDYSNYEQLKNTKSLSEDQVKKQIGTVLYREQMQVLSDLRKEIKRLASDKEDLNDLDEEAIQIAKKYSINNVNNLSDLKEQIRLKKEYLNTVKKDKSVLANQRPDLIAKENAKQAQINQDKDYVKNAAKQAEINYIQSRYGGSKASLSATRSAVHSNIQNLQGSISKEGKENLFTDIKSKIVTALNKVVSELTQTNKEVESIDDTNQKLATQSERMADESDVKSGVKAQINATNKDGQKTREKTDSDGDKTRAALLDQKTQRAGRLNEMSVAKTTLSELQSKLPEKGIVGDGEQVSTATNALQTKLDVVLNSIKQASNIMEFKPDASNFSDDAVQASYNMAKAFIKKLDTDFNEFLRVALKTVKEDIKGVNEFKNKYALKDENGDFKTKNGRIEYQPGKNAEGARQEQKLAEYETQKKQIEAMQKLYSKGLLTNLLGATDQVQEFNQTTTNTLPVLKDFGKNAQDTGHLLTKAAEQTQFMGSALDDIKNKVGYFLSMNFVFDKIVQKIQEAGTFTKELDKDMTQIGLVLGQTASQTWKNFDSYAQMADRLSTTTSDVTAAMKLFYQQGLNTVEVNQMVEASAIAAALGESTMAEASETLTSIVNSYNLSAQDAISVTDKISQVAIVSAADFGEISTAIEKVASSAASAGLDLDHLMGYLGKMIETTREAPTNVGTALKTIVANFSQFKDDPNAKNEDGNDVNKVDKALKTVGIDLLDTSGEMKDLGKVIDELGVKWKTLSRNTKAYLATMIAGTRQQSRFYALMNDYDRTLELVNESSKSNGKSTQQFSIYQDSLTAATQRLQNQWEKFYQTTLKGDGILKSLANGLTKVLNVMNKIGPVWTTVFGIAAINGLQKIANHTDSLFNSIKKTRDFNLSAEGLAKNYQQKGDQTNVLAQQQYGLAQPGKLNVGGAVANFVGKQKGLPEAIGEYQKLIDIQTKLGKVTDDTGLKQLLLDDSFKKQVAGLKNNTLATTLNSASKKDEAMAAVTDAVSTQGETVSKIGATAATWGLYAAQVALTAGLAALGAIISAVVTGIQKWANAGTVAEQESRDLLQAQKEENDQLKELSDKYADLNKLVSLSDDEHAELKNTIQKLGELYPDLIESYDEEGKALTINNQKLQERIRSENELLKIKSKNALENTLNNKKKNLNAYQQNMGSYYFGGGFLKWNRTKAFLTNNDLEKTAIGDQSKNAMQDQKNTIDTLMTRGKQIKFKGGNVATTGKNTDNILKSYAAQLITPDQALTELSVKKNKIMSKIDPSDSDKIKEVDEYFNSLSSFIESSNKVIDNANKSDIRSMMNDVTNSTVQSSEMLDDSRKQLALNTINSSLNKSQENMSDGAFKEYAKSDKFQKMIEQHIDQISMLDQETIDEFNDILNNMHNGQLNVDEAGKQIDAIIEQHQLPETLASYAYRQLEEYDKSLTEMFNQSWLSAETKENLKKVNGNSLKQLNSGYQKYVKQLTDLEKLQFNQLINNLYSNPEFFTELATLDATNLTEVQNFKTKYAKSLGKFGEDFFNELIKNPQYDAEQVTSSLNNISQLRQGQGTTLNAQASVSDVTNGNSEEAAHRLLATDDANKTQNLMMVGNKLKISAEEVGQAYRDMYQEVSNSCQAIMNQADQKINQSVDSIRTVLKDQDWEIGDNIDFSKLTANEKKVIDLQMKQATNLMTQKHNAEQVKKAYSQLNAEQQAIVDYAPFQNGVIAVNDMVNSLDNLASIYDVVTNKEYTQLDLVKWLSEDTTGELLNALQVENGQLVLNAQSMEYMAEVRKQEAITAIDAQIAKAEGQLYYLENVNEATEAELQDIKDVNDAKVKLGQNDSEVTQSMGNNLFNYVNAFKQNVSTILKNYKKLISAALKWWKADKGEQTDDNVGTAEGGAQTVETHNPEDLIDIEAKKKKLQENIDKLKALKADIGKMSGKDLMKGVNDIGSYGGSGGGGSGGDKDKFDAMVEKLEHFYNYLRQIEALESKINKLRERRSLIDATENYYIADLAEENQLLKEQASLYGRYISDEVQYLADMRGQLAKAYGDWVYFNDEGVVQVKQTEFNINSEAEEERYKQFSELLNEYQSEYNKMLENQNKLYGIQATIVENINTMYDKHLQKLTDMTERLEYMNSISEHRVNMEFGSIEKLKLMSDQIKTTADMLLYAQKSVNELEGDFNILTDTIQKSGLKSLLIWDENLQKYFVDNEKLNDPKVRAEFEAQGFNWEDVVTKVNAMAAASQKITNSLKESNEQLMSAREALKQLHEERISTIDEVFSKATEELEKFYNIYNTKIQSLGTENDLFGTKSENLDKQYDYLISVAKHSKAVIQGLKENNQNILDTLNKDYSDYVTMVDGVAYLNKVAIEESKTLTEGEKANLLELYQLYYDSKEQIDEMNDKFYEYIAQIKAMEEAKRDAIIDLKQRIHDELIARDQQEIDELAEKYQKMNALDQEYYSKLQQRISDARNARAIQQDQQDLTQMQNRLNVLQQDNSGQYNNELIELQRQINERLQAQSDRDIDLEMQRIEREQQQREEDRALQITQMENLLTFKDENGIYWQMTQDMLALNQEAIVGFLASSQEFENQSVEWQAKELEGMKDLAETAAAELSTNSKFVTDDFRKSLEDFVKSPIDSIPGDIATGANQIVSQIHTATTVFINTMSGLFKYLDELTGKTDAKGYNTGIIDKDTGVYTPPQKRPPKPPAPPAPPAPANPKPALGKGAYVQVKSGARWYYDSYGMNPSGRARSGTIKYINTRGSHPYNIEGLGWIKKSDIVGYSKGGYVDYTGIAAVHGKTNKPEAFLNSRQTALFAQLRDALMNTKINSAYKTEDKDDKDNIVIENFTIDVKELADTDSIDKVVKTVKDSIYRDATSGNNMKINRRR